MFVLFSESWTQWPFWTGPRALQGSATLLPPPFLPSLSRRLVCPRCPLETGPLARVFQGNGRRLWGDTLQAPSVLMLLFPLTATFLKHFTP